MSTLYVRDGSRFVPVDEGRPARPLPPIPVPVRVVDVDEDGVPADWRPDPYHPHRTLVPAPKCRHGHFARWAAKNCCAERGHR